MCLQPFQSGEREGATTATQWLGQGRLPFFDGAAAQKHGRKKATDARFETMIGRSSWVDSVFVWFPAAWMPLVIDALREKSYMYTQSVSQLGAVAFTDRSPVELPEAQEFSYRVKRWQADQKRLLPCPTITHQSGLAHI